MSMILLTTRETYTHYCITKNILKMPIMTSSNNNRFTENDIIRGLNIEVEVSTSTIIPTKYMSPAQFTGE